MQRSDLKEQGRDTEGKMARVGERTERDRDGKWTEQRTRLEKEAQTGTHRETWAHIHTGPCRGARDALSNLLSTVPRAV